MVWLLKTGPPGVLLPPRLSPGTSEFKNKKMTHQKSSFQNWDIHPLQLPVDTQKTGERALLCCSQKPSRPHHHFCQQQTTQKAGSRPLAHASWIVSECFCFGGTIFTSKNLASRQPGKYGFYTTNLCRRGRPYRVGGGGMGDETSAVLTTPRW